MDFWEENDGDGDKVSEEEIVDSVSNPCQNDKACHGNCKIDQRLLAPPTHIPGVCSFYIAQNSDKVLAERIISLLLLLIPIIAQYVWEEFGSEVICYGEDESDEGNESKEAWIPAPDCCKKQGESSSSDICILIRINN